MDIIVKEPHEIEAEMQDLSRRALAIRVRDADTLLQADEMLSVYKQMEKKIKEFFRPEKEAADRLHKQIVAKEKAELSKLIVGEQHLKKEIASYRIMEQSRREEEEARLRVEALKREEDERIARAAIIEEEALKLKNMGMESDARELQREAEKILETPKHIPAPRVAPLPRTKSSVRMIVDRTAIQQVVDRLGDKTNIPGIRVYPVWQFTITDESLIPEAYKRPVVVAK